MSASPTSGPANGFSDFWRGLIVESATTNAALTAEMAAHRQELQRNTAAVADLNHSLSRFALKVGGVAGGMTTLVAALGWVLVR